jgi:hypothetical protein
MGREADQVGLKMIELRTALRNQLGGIAVEGDATGTAGLSHQGSGLKGTDLTLGSNQRNHASWKGQKLLQELQTDQTVRINRPEHNGPTFGFQLICSSQNSWMLNPRHDNSTRGMARRCTKNCEMDGLCGS